MNRLFQVAGVLVTLATGSLAGETTVRLRVRPMPVPSPALKYRLLPELSELKPGNPAQDYVKCFMEQHSFFYGAKSVADRARYQTMALADLPQDELKGYGGSALRQADWAARLATLDWDALERVQNGGIEDVPGELGPLQILAAALNVRFRAEVAGKRFDDAVRTAKTMFALARHLGDHPTEVANLVGLGTANLALGTLADMVQQPGCPNLFWALTDLPYPLVEVRKGSQGQRLIGAALLRPLSDAAAQTETELETFVARLSGVLSYAREQAGRAPWSVRTMVHERANDAQRVRTARRRLIDAGCAPDRINTLPQVQVILLDAKHEFERMCDEREKLLGLPVWQIGSSPVENRERALLADLLPDVDRLRRAQAQLQERIAVLCHVEALRDYAARHDGKLPATPGDLSVPPPLDPMTGKAFEQTIEGATAHIRGGNAGNAATAIQAGATLHYEVTIDMESKRRP